MLAYALFLCFVGTFIATTIFGHVLVLSALYPGLFGSGVASTGLTEEPPQLQAAEPLGLPPEPKLAA